MGFKRVEAVDIKFPTLRVGPPARGKSVGNVYVFKGSKRVEAADVKYANLCAGPPARRKSMGNFGFS